MVFTVTGVDLVTGVDAGLVVSFLPVEVLCSGAIVFTEVLLLMLLFLFKLVVSASEKVPGEESAALVTRFCVLFSMEAGDIVGESVMLLLPCCEYVGD